MRRAASAAEMTLLLRHARLKPPDRLPTSARDRAAASVESATLSDLTPSSPVAAGAPLPAIAAGRAGPSGRRDPRGRASACSSPSTLRSSTSPFGAWVMQSRPISEPSSPCTSKPVSAYLVVKASWNWASRPFLKRMHAHHAVLQARAPHAALRVMATTANGSSSSTKRSVSASWTVMSSTTPPPASGRSMRQPCRCGGR